MFDEPTCCQTGADVGPRVGAGVGELSEIWTNNTQKNPLIQRVSRSARKTSKQQIFTISMGREKTLLTGGCPACGGWGVGGGWSEREGAGR